MVEPIVKTPWNTRMDPDEFRDYYERKLEAMKRPCKREECDGTAEFPRDYCSMTCENIALREAAARLEELLGE